MIMKKFIKKLWGFITTLQFGLSIIALLSWFQAYTIGRLTSVGNTLTGNYQRVSETKYSATDVSSGHDGGALAMGLICCVCIIMIVWIEINKKPKP